MNKGNYTDKKSNRNGNATDMLPLYGKVAPQSIDIEKTILGAILMEGLKIFDVTNRMLTADAFYKDSNQIIYRTIQDMAASNRFIDMLTVVDDLKSKGKLEQVGGHGAVSDLTRYVSSTADVTIRNYCTVLKQKFMMRQIITVSSEFLAAAYDDMNDPLQTYDLFQEQVNAIGLSHYIGDMIPMSTSIVKTLEQVEEWERMKTPVTGVTSGHANLDNATRGWQPGDLIIIAARPSVGKTAFAIDLAMNAAKAVKPVPVAVWSMEMRHEALSLRALSGESGVNMYSLQTGKFSAGDKIDKILPSADRMMKMPIYFSDQSSTTLNQIKSLARIQKKKSNIGLILIDYLQLMESDKQVFQREQEISKFSRGLKNLAMELQIPIIALSQLSREVEKGKKGIAPPNFPICANLVQLSRTPMLLSFCGSLLMKLFRRMHL